jgi:hypothetical protein
MALLSLTATQLPKTGASAPLNLTSLLAAGVLTGYTGVSFVNTGKEVLYANVTSGASTCSIAIGTTVEGEPVTSLTPALVSSAINVIGPFPGDEDVQPGNLIEVTFGTVSAVTVALLQNVGVY